MAFALLTKKIQIYLLHTLLRGYYSFKLSARTLPYGELMTMWMK